LRKFSKFGYVRAPDKHLDQVIVQAVKELSLKVPFEAPRLDFPGLEYQPVTFVVDPAYR
jgi:hypothetical protein